MARGGCVVNRGCESLCRSPLGRSPPRPRVGVGRGAARARDRVYPQGHRGGGQARPRRPRRSTAALRRGVAQGDAARVAEILHDDAVQPALQVLWLQAQLGHPRAHTTLKRVRHATAAS